MIPANRAMKTTAQLDRNLDGLFMVLMDFSEGQAWARLNSVWLRNFIIPNLTKKSN
jgi:hypothetical protein